MVLFLGIAKTGRASRSCSFEFRISNFNFPPWHIDCLFNVESEREYPSPTIFRGAVERAEKETPFAAMEARGGDAGDDAHPAAA